MNLKLQAGSWWERDRYTDGDLIPSILRGPEYWGPKGPALVRAHEDGTTQQGWGLNPPKNSDEGFMPRYLRGEFLARRTEYGYDKGKHAAAYVMRSGRLVVVDIDGKNGGLEHASELGALPYTLAETSKSGNGYHLFYVLPADAWDEVEGFGTIHDHIGIVQGVDIRGVGCVYHYPSQRWNERDPAPAPQWLLDRLLKKQQERAASALSIAKIKTLDETEILMMHAELIDELAKPIKSGKRNNTLFAIGSKLKLAEVPDWETKVRDRAIDVGLDGAEADKLVENISNYA